MALVIFGDLFTFPEGNAATNRVYTYAKGFKENGVNTHVVCFENEYLEVNHGIIDGINFYHPFGQNKRNKYFIVRRYLKLLKYYRAIKIIRKINKEDKTIAINSWTNLFSTHLFAWLLAKICNAKLITECSEHPMRHFQSSSFKKKIGGLKFYIESKLCNGVFCISQFLVNYYKKHEVNQRKLFLVPSTVDPIRFNQNGDSPFSFEYIGYFGALTFEKDNIDNLIMAFNVVSKNNPEVHLVLGGFCSQKDKKQIEDLISHQDEPLKVHLLEYLTRQEITKYIVHSYILVMVRANDLDSIASYPSKLTEFLATSKPVVTVNVGEVSNYLTDGLNAFIVEPGNSNLLGEKLNFILDNYEMAKKVGLNGKELTKTIFNYNFQAKRMLSFINSLYS